MNPTMIDEKMLEYYLALPYQLIITPDDEGFGVAIVGLPGCITHTQKWEEIPAMIHGAKYSWIASSLQHGDPINEPEQIPVI